MNKISATLPYFLYDPKRSEWIPLFDGFTLGQARGSDKFAVELENSSNHCVFRLDDKNQSVQLLDLGSPGGTCVNENFIPFATEVSLSENDSIQINGRELFLTRGKVLPKPKTAKIRQATGKPRGTPSPKLPLPRNPYPQATPAVRGAAHGNTGKKAALKSLAGLFRVAIVRTRSFWVDCVSSALKLASIRDPLLVLVAAVLAALTLWKVAGRHAHTPEALPIELVARSEFSLPQQPLQALAPSETEVHLPPPSPPHTMPMIGASKPATPPALAQVARIEHAAPFAPTTPTIAHDDEAHAISTRSLPSTSHRERVESHSRSNSDLDLDLDTNSVHFRVTAISVMNSESRRTTFESLVDSNTVVTAFNNMNQPARSIASESSSGESNSSQRFYSPSVTRDGASYRVDWCNTWESDCGKPAADTFCREMGQNSATSFEIAPRIGDSRQPTAIIGQSEVYCPGDHPGHNCDGFSFIECK